MDYTCVYILCVDLQEGRFCVSVCYTYIRMHVPVFKHPLCMPACARMRTHADTSTSGGSGLLLLIQAGRDHSITLLRQKATSAGPRLAVQELGGQPVADEMLSQNLFDFQQICLQLPPGRPGTWWPARGRWRRRGRSPAGRSPRLQVCVCVWVGDWVGGGTDGVVVLVGGRFGAKS